MGSAALFRRRLRRVARRRVIAQVDKGESWVVGVAYRVQKCSHYQAGYQIRQGSLQQQDGPFPCPSLARFRLCGLPAVLSSSRTERKVESDISAKKNDTSIADPHETIPPAKASRAAQSNGLGLLIMPARIPLIPVIFPHNINLDTATVPIARPPAAAFSGEKCSDILNFRASNGPKPSDFFMLLN